MNGPYAIVCRAHSGGRFMSEAFIRNGIQMGVVHPDTKDTKYFAVRSNPYINEIILKAFKYADMPDKRKKYFQDLMRQCINEYIEKGNKDLLKPFGWKFGETLFAMPVLFDTFPSAKAIHIIRDGRDVMLSRIPARFNPRNFHDAFNKLMIFGKQNVNKFNGEKLDKVNILKYRTELELIHWQTVVEFGMTLRTYKDQYLEIRYEDMCHDPVKTLDQISEFIGVPFKDKVKKWAINNVSTARIGKWKNEDGREMNKIIALAKPTLDRLRYK